MLTLLRAAGSLTVLVVLLAGLPLLLWWGTAAVGPDGVRALGNLLSTQDSGQVFLLALAVAGWIGWALFALSVLLEIPAQLRGRTAPQIRLLVGQRAAATLVGAVLLALPTGTALAASATPAQASPTVAAASVLSGSHTTGGTHDEAPAAQAVKSAVTHTVLDARPAESLWSITEQRLGDGNRWEEIADLNAGNTMADGSVFRADGPIQPGWTLRLPTDAAPAAPLVTAPEQTEAEGGLSTQEHRSVAADDGDVYTVAPGDNLSKIADKELGDADAYPAIFELNKGDAQPGGGTFTNPDLLYPGQKLDLPAQADAPGTDRNTGDRGRDETAGPDTEPCGRRSRREHPARPRRSSPAARPAAEPARLRSTLRHPGNREAGRRGPGRGRPRHTGQRQDPLAQRAPSAAHEAFGPHPVGPVGLTPGSPAALRSSPDGSGTEAR